MSVGALKGIDDFDLRNVLVRKNFDITLRFNTFSEAIKALMPQEWKVYTEWGRLIEEYELTVQCQVYEP